MLGISSTWGTIPLKFFFIISVIMSGLLSICSWADLASVFFENTPVSCKGYRSHGFKVVVLQVIIGMHRLILCSSFGQQAADCLLYARKALAKTNYSLSAIAHSQTQPMADESYTVSSTSQSRMKAWSTWRMYL